MKREVAFWFSVASLMLVLSCMPQLVPITDSKETNTLPASITNDKPIWEVEWSNVLGSARKEGTLVVHATGTSFYARPAQVKIMKEKYGIELQMASGRGEEIAQKILAERRGGIYNADIYIGGATTILNQLKPAGLLDPIEPALILPEVLNGEGWFDKQIRFIDKDKRALVFIAYPNTTLSVSSELVKDGELVSYKDVLNPKWKGKIVIDDPTVAGSGLKIFAYLGSIVFNMDYWKEFAKLEPAIARDKRLPVEWLAKGKYSIGMALTPGTINDFIEAGAPIKFVPTKEGTYLTSGSGVAVIINRAPHPNAVKVYVNWLLSREGQTLFSEATGSQSARVDVPTSHLAAHATRQSGVNYFLSDTEEFALTQLETAKIALEIFGPLMR